LVIDDDPDMAELVRIVFAREGAEVYSAADGREGVCQYGAWRPDLVLMDVMMPGLDGWNTCRVLRELSDVPIIFLTALDREGDVVRGLDFGAVDYVTKPFTANVLLSRARSALRRAARGSGSSRQVGYDDGHLSVDIAGHQVRVGGKRVSLTATEFRLLACLVEHKGRVLTHEQILERVWGYEYRESIGYVHVYISHLRQKIEANPARHRYLLNERGVGYRFVAQRSAHRGHAA
jgi:two-component system KDP operon response regulator KdpE